MSGGTLVNSSAPEGDQPERDDDHDVPVLDESRFVVGEEKARGGIGRILAADDRFLGRRVAVKQLQVEDDLQAARFLREALITARLQHPNIVPVYDAGVRAGGESYYTMRLVGGSTLREVIEATRSLDE